MRVEYARRAVSDIRTIAAFYASSRDPRVGERVAARLREIVARLARLPESGRPVADRPGLRVAPLIRYPFNVFYTITGDAVRM